MVERQTRASHTAMAFSQKNRDYLDEIHIPIESIGICQGKTTKNTPCLIYGELGDGLCITCWDRSHKRIITMKQERRRKKIEEQGNLKELVEFLELLNAG